MCEAGPIPPLGKLERVKVVLRMVKHVLTSLGEEFERSGRRRAGEHEQRSKKKRLLRPGHNDKGNLPWSSRTPVQVAKELMTFKKERRRSRIAAHICVVVY